MNPTDILLSIAIVGIYTLIYVYLKSKYDDKQILVAVTEKRTKAQIDNYVDSLVEVNNA